MPDSQKTVDGYIEALPAGQGAIVRELRRIILAAAPDATESIKWSQPVYELNGPFAYIQAYPKAVNFGFWRGSSLADPGHRLIGTGQAMRHVKLTALSEIDEEAFGSFIREAVQLNAMKGDPTRGL